MSIHDPRWKYVPHSETVKPGYLQRKFARIRSEQAAKQATSANVRPLRKAAK